MRVRQPNVRGIPVVLPVVLSCLAGCRLGGVLDRTVRLDKGTKTALEQLKSEDREDRLDGVRRLGRSQGHKHRVAPALIEALSDPDPEIQKTAAASLRMLLGRPDLPDSRAVWEEEWRRAKPRLKKEKDLSIKSRLKMEKARLKNDEGVLLMARGDFKGAEALFLEAIAQDPDDPMSWNNLGKCNANQGRYDIAVDRFLKALELDPQYAVARYNLAETYLNISKLTSTNRTFEALGHIEQALALDKKQKEWPPRLLEARILHHMAMSEPGTAERIDVYRRAADAIEEAKKIGPGVPEVRKTAALIAYGRELHYAAYKEVMALHELGYNMDPGFLERLEAALRQEAFRRGIDPPKMPSGPKGPVRKGPPPSLRTPYVDYRR